MSEETFRQKLESVLRTCGILQLENVTLNSAVLALQNTNAELSTTNKDLSRSLSEPETYSRRVNIVIRSLPEQSLAETAVRSSDASPTDDLQTGISASVEQTVASFFHTKLQLDITTQDISSAHRLSKTGKDVSRPIIVRFLSIKTRDSVMRAKKILRADTGSYVFISDHLTQKNSTVL